MSGRRGRGWMVLCLLAASAVYALPTYLMVVSSLRTSEELRRNPLGLWPAHGAWENYAQALRAFPLAHHLANSLWLCGGCVLGTTLSCSLVAYALARVRWRGRGLAMSLVLVTMLLPWHVAMIPRFWLVRQLGLYDSLAALILPTFLGNAFFIFLLRQFFLTLPEELFEAGRMDGMGHGRLFWNIAVPLSRPALTAVALFQFIETWNDFSGPLLYLNDPHHFPLVYGLERFVSAYRDQTHLLLAAAVLFTIFPVAIFLLAQRAFVRGITTTGIKT